MDRKLAVCLDLAFFVNRVARDVHDAAQSRLADGNRDWLAKVGDGLTANQTLGRFHCDGTDGVLAQVLRNFENNAVAVVVRFECVQDRWQRAVERYVDNGPDDLTDFPDACVAHGVFLGLLAPSRKTGVGLEGFGARDNLDQFAGNRGLT